MRVLIAGCGYVGLRLAVRLAEAGHEVFGLKRQPPTTTHAFTWLRGDLTGSAYELPDRLDGVVLAAGLRRDTEAHYRDLLVEGYQRLLARVEASSARLSRVVLVSTTGVFAESDGGWVDETSPVNADRSPTRYYVESEAMVARFPASTTVARLSGIYGPGRNRMIREVQNGAARLFPPPVHYLNHIHADDAAGALAHLLTHAEPEPLYIVSDPEPTDRNEVVRWIAKTGGWNEPPPAGTDAPRPSRRSGNKRCSPARLLASGYRFQYPSFREGYAALMTS
ncbi:MAG TPA: NAD-dependent epimerase/dehydratase family protein [Kiritimatiellia bacterium]|nr:NAD-dependent epimerase/dehydratase family protein [Kiritimatiellia bacterium]